MSDEELSKLCDKLETYASGNFNEDEDVPKSDALAISRALKSRITADRWIPVSERMPEPGVMVLVAHNWMPAHVSVTEAKYRPEHGEWDNDNWNRGVEVASGAVTHWRPLPSPPEAHP